MVFIGFIILLGYAIRRLQLIYGRREHTFNQMEVAYTEDEMNAFDITLGKFNNSMNFITG